jgi:hypothetical protein
MHRVARITLHGARRNGVFAGLTAGYDLDGYTAERSLAQRTV